MTQQITKYGPCPDCGGYIKPCRCHDETRLREMDLKTIRAKVEALEHSGLFRRCPDVLAKINGAVEGALADIAIERIK
ncbi:MAG: hypothetical protein WBN66_03625 [Smithella sp.]